MLLLNKYFGLPSIGWVLRTKKWMMKCPLPSKSSWSSPSPWLQWISSSWNQMPTPSILLSTHVSSFLLYISSIANICIRTTLSSLVRSKIIVIIFIQISHVMGNLLKENIHDKIKEIIRRHSGVSRPLMGNCYLPCSALCIFHRR